MGHGIATIHIRMQQRKVRVLGMGKTNTGQRFVRASTELKVRQISDSDFKREMAAAVSEMLGQASLPI